MRRARTVTATSGNPFTGGGVEAPILEVFLFVGLLFIIVNYSLSRLSRRLEIREKKRTGSKPEGRGARPRGAGGIVRRHGGT